MRAREKGRKEPRFRTHTERERSPWGRCARGLARARQRDGLRLDVSSFVFFGMIETIGRFTLIKFVEKSGNNRDSLFRALFRMKASRDPPSLSGFTNTLQHPHGSPLLKTAALPYSAIRRELFREGTPWGGPTFFFPTFRTGFRFPFNSNLKPRPAKTQQRFHYNKIRGAKIMKPGIPHSWESRRSILIFV